MKLVNHLLLRLSVSFLAVLFVWSLVYFFIQMNEVYDGIDEGLNNLRQEFILKANSTESFVADMVKYNPLNMMVEEISAEKARTAKETYSTAKLYFPSELEEEEVRMLTATFRCELDQKYYQLKIFTSTVESDDLIENMLYLLIVLWLVLASALVFSAKIIILKSSKPFRKLLLDLNKFQLGKSEMIKFEPTTIDEYEELNKVTEKLLHENMQAFVNQKNFIENTSHELQTPLAIALNKLEWMLDDKTLSRGQMEEINATLQILNRIKKLNSGLLLLAKIKNKQFEDNELQLNTVFEETVCNLEHLIEYKEIKIRIIRNSQLTVRMNVDLAYVMATNLLKNAVSYNVKGGEIQIIFNPDSVTIANDGEPPKNPERNIFERYFSAADGSQSYGLGLSIVKSIADRYYFGISYQYDRKHIIVLTIK
jgi:signal transduction histidine kinase